MDEEVTISKPVAPEDIRADDYVAITEDVLQFVRWECGAAIPGSGPELGSVLCYPIRGPEPLRVVLVCLPFVLVEDAKGKHRTLDVRQVRLTRLTERFGKKSFKRLARPGRPELSKDC